MSGRTILKIENPTTQSIDSVKSLLAYVGRASDPLPTDLSLDGGRVVLILSNKKDAYYTCTARACSCPGNQFRHDCKHMRRYFPQAQAQAEAAQIKPTASEPLIKRGGFKPFDLLPSEEKAKASLFVAVIDCHDTTALDVAYHSIREDREMWPMCEA